jgi:hypothetical protein
VTSAVNSFVTGSQTYVFSYQQSNITRFFVNTGADEWCWGYEGSTELCEVSASGDDQFVATQSALDAGQNLTVAFGFAPETFAARESSYFATEPGFV